ncbi:hypothetical protein CYMTET_11422, partial [Cymbomonas tetramitiformis]
MQVELITSGWEEGRSLVGSSTVVPSQRQVFLERLIERSDIEGHLKVLALNDLVKEGALSKDEFQEARAAVLSRSRQQEQSGTMKNASARSSGLHWTRRQPEMHCSNESPSYQSHSHSQSAQQPQNQQVQTQEDDWNIAMSQMDATCHRWSIGHTAAPSMGDPPAAPL